MFPLLWSKEKTVNNMLSDLCSTHSLGFICSHMIIPVIFRDMVFSYNIQAQMFQRLPLLKNDNFWKCLLFFIFHGKFVPLFWDIAIFIFWSTSSTLKVVTSYIGISTQERHILRNLNQNHLVMKVGPLTNTLENILHDLKDCVPEKDPF